METFNLALSLKQSVLQLGFLPKLVNTLNGFEAGLLVAFVKVVLEQQVIHHKQNAIINVIECMYHKHMQQGMMNYKNMKSNLIEKQHSSSELLKAKEAIAKEFNLGLKHQSSMFKELSQQCSQMDYGLTGLENLLSRLATRCQELSDHQQKHSLSTLKTKQNEFIINELKQSISKATKKEQRLIEDLQTQKKKNDKSKQEIIILENKCQIYQEKILRLETEVKDNQQASHFRKSEIGDVKDRSISRSMIRKEKERDEQYVELEEKIADLERDFNERMDVYIQKNGTLSKQIKKFTECYEIQREKSLLLRKELESFSMVKYQLELKLKQQTIAYSQLEQSYESLLQKNTASQISFHQQLHQLKLNQSEERNQVKKYKKEMKSLLTEVVSTINSGRYYFSSNTNSLTDVANEIKDLASKYCKKSWQSACQDRDLTKLDNQKLKLLSEEQSKRNSQLERELASVFEKQQSRQKSNLNSSMMKSQKSQSDQRYKQKVESLRKDLKNKQKIINQLEKLQNTEFEKSKKTILELELNLSEKNNQCRKLTMKLKDKDQESETSILSLKAQQNKVKENLKKIEKEKEDMVKNYDKKIYSLEDKLKSLKASLKDIEKKQQEKTYKYNKLKSRFEKYQVEVSESLRRKNGQIEHMIIEGNRLKADVKILTEKLHLAELLQQTSPMTSETPNRDLIEQIEMERDRIVLDYQSKEKQCSELKDINAKCFLDYAASKKQIKDLRVSNCELEVQKQHLQRDLEVERHKKEFIESKKEKDKEQEYFTIKKELEKALSNFKKAEKSYEKSQKESKELRNQLQEEKDSSRKQVGILENSLLKQKEKQKKQQVEIDSTAEKHKKQKKDYERRLSQFATKEEQLINIINYKNNEQSHLRESMKGEEEMQDLHRGILIEMGMVTEEVQTTERGTQPEEAPENNYTFNIKPDHNLIPNEIYDLQVQEDLKDQEMEKQERKEEMELRQDLIEKKDIVGGQKGTQKGKEADFEGYFADLAGEEANFQICEEGEELNMGRAALNLQMKDLFNALRNELEKVFNGEDISMEVMKVLPGHLEDDYSELMVYIREKLGELQQLNNLSFIEMQEGREYGQTDFEPEIMEFVQKKSLDYLLLTKIIEEKEEMITGLMNEKTEQENTINQLTLEKEEVEEENQNRFMNQCKIYKEEIKHNKKKIDVLEMAIHSIKNIFKNVFEIFTSQEDNEDDLRDNFELYSNICQLTNHEKAKLGSYIQKYREARGLK